jgi:hypothetical protein
MFAKNVCKKCLVVNGVINAPKMPNFRKKCLEIFLKDFFFKNNGYVCQIF